MEHYKFQFSIDKKDFPKLKDQALRMAAVFEQIKNGKAELSLFEKTDAIFDYPSGAGNFPEWDGKIDSNLLVETSALLSNEIVGDEMKLRAYIYEKLSKTNLIEYLYDDEMGRHISFAFMDNDFDEAEFKIADDKAKEKAIKKVNEQIDMFKKKPKSK